MSQLNKKGDSLMVGYVLLIAIAVALSTAVFFYLKLYLPDEKPDCYQDINLVIDSVKCVINPAASSSTVYINITNKGFFNVDSAFIKIGESNRIFRETLNDPDEYFKSSCNGYSLNLTPGATFCEEYNYNSISAGVKEISVEPLIYIENKPVLCPEAIVSKNIVCA